MDAMEAARQRHSVRKYTADRISDVDIAALKEEIEKCNSEGSLSIVLITDEPKGFGGLMTKATGFSNAVNYMAMIGPDTPDLNEKCGYYGERLVLLAQSLGLRTCWAMFCSKKHCSQFVKDGERMVIGISVGYGENDGVPHKNKPMEKMADLADAPEWFLKGMECVMLAPSGINRQPIYFSQKDGAVTVQYKESNLTRIDCGIAKYHFELGAGKENFRWA